MTQSLLIDIFMFLFGTVFGSFFNVCIYRLPKEESIVWPGSHCMSCGKPVRWYDNIPVLSYFALGGKCRDCGTRFSFRYAFVECLTGLAFLWVWLHYGFKGEAFVAILLFSGLFVASMIDFDHQIIPDEISLGGLLVGLVISAFLPVLHGETVWNASLLRSFLGALFGGGIIYATGVIGTLIFRKDAMGGGDVKLMAMLGAFLGWQKVLLVYLLAPVMALPMALFFKFAKKMEVIPFGPFLSLAGWIAFVWGDQLIHWYFGGFFQ